MAGSDWAIWDLHLHTPASLHQGYGSGEQAWDRFILDLESLPESFKVIGINDYLFLDGYERLIREKRDNGRLANISVLLPVVEFRIDKFSGSGNHIKRLNFHVIFSESLDPELIRQQFLSAIYGQYQLDSQADGIDFNSAITKESLCELGSRLIENTKEDIRKGMSSPLLEGFNNINFPYERIREVLSQRVSLRGKYLTAMGKAEWEQMRWDGGASAEKRTLVNSCDLLFSCSDSVDAYRKSVSKLSSDKVNRRLFDCSDAHFYSDSTEKNKIGKCLTWVNAEYGLEGLRQAVYEFETRVKISESRPPGPVYKIDNISLDFPSDSEISSNGADKSAFCFSGKHSIDFNPQYTCIIGGRGAGKSTLINLLKMGSGFNTSFFEANKLYHDSKVVNLGASVAVEGSVSQAEFVDQNQIEALAGSSSGLTKAVLDRVIKHDRNRSLEKMFSEAESNSMIMKEVVSMYRTISSLVDQKKHVEYELSSISKMNNVLQSSEYVSLKEKLSKADSDLQNEISLNKDLVEFLDDVKDLVSKWVARPYAEGDSGSRGFLYRSISLLSSFLKYLEAEGFSGDKKRVSNLREEVERARKDIYEYMLKMGVSEENIQEVSSSSEKEAVYKNKMNEIELSLAALIEEASSRYYDGVIISRVVDSLNETAGFIGNDIAVDGYNVQPIKVSFSYNKKALREMFCEFVADSISHLPDKRRPSLEAVYEFYDDLGWPDEVTDEKFYSRLMDYKGGKLKLCEVLRDIYSAPYFSKVFRFYYCHLSLDLRRNIVAKVLYGGKDISQLSFGQKCTAVLVILLSFGNGPLIIDEPEAHLDGRLIAEYLVGVIKNKKLQRQIIFATHNANLVVNGDANLILHLGPDENGVSKIVPFSIESIEYRDRLLALEGGQEAFDLRRKKYSLHT